MRNFEQPYSLTMFPKHKDWHSFDTATLDCSIMSFNKLFANGGAWTFLTTLSTCIKRSRFAFPVCFLKHDSAILAISLSHEFGAHRAEGPSPAP
jgi:hypothetical protein